MPLLAVRESKAAEMLDLSQDEFRRLVASGALPKPDRIGRNERWSVDKLRAVISGDAGLPEQDIE